MWEYGVAAGLIVALVMHFSTKHKRQDPIKEGSKTNISIRSRFKSSTLDVYLPPTSFVNSMKKHLDKEVAVLEEYWKQEREKFMSTWEALPDTHKQYFAEQLFSELEISLEPYSDLVEFVNVLAPDLAPEFVLSKTGADGKNGVDRLMNALFNKKSALYIEPTIVLSARKYEENLDPNRPKVDTVLLGASHYFINTLRQLALAMYVKQFLTRYKVRTGKIQKVKKYVAAIVIGLISMGLMLVMQEMGVLDGLFFGFGV